MNISFNKFNFLEKTLETIDSPLITSGQVKDSFSYNLLGNGIMLLKPTKQNESTKSILLSCAVHGNETAPIEIINKIITDIFSLKLSIKHNILFILGNPRSIIAKKRFTIENLNRLFNGKWNDKAENYEVLRAKEIEKHVDSFFQNVSSEKLHYDLHTAIKPSIHEKFAIYPFLHEREYNEEQLVFIKDCGVDNILLANSPATTFSYHTSYNYKAHAFTVELGKVKDFGNNDPQDFIQVDKSLRELISNDETRKKQFSEADFNIYKVVKEIIKNSAEFKFHVDDTKNFTPFPKSTLISSDKNDEYRTLSDNERIVFPNKNVALGQRAAFMVSKSKIK